MMLPVSFIAGLVLALDANAVPPNCHAIESDQILARDVAAVIPAFASLPSEFLLGYVSTSGAPRTFHAVDLERIAKNRGYELHDLPEICFVRKTFVPTAEQIHDAIAETLAMPAAKIEIVASSQPARPPAALQ